MCAALSDAEVIERYRTLLEAERRIESVLPADTWLERAQQQRRDASIRLELSAVMMEFEVRGFTEQEVAS